VSTASKFACLLSISATLVLAAMAWIAAQMLTPILTEAPSRPMQLVPVAHFDPTVPIAPPASPPATQPRPEPIAERWRVGPDGSLVFPMEVRPSADFFYDPPRSEP
jgi:hypothetical protein